MEAAKTSTPINEVLKIAHEERRHLIHTYVGTEHLLLAAIRCLHDDAAPYFAKEGLDLETLRSETLRVLDPNYQHDESQSTQ